jgi:hypothetical protein
MLVATGSGCPHYPREASMDTRTLLSPWRRLLSAVLVVPLLLAASAILVSARWIDLPGGDLQSYGISEGEVARISQGFGLRWEPYRQMSRAQFVKMLRQAGEVAPAVGTTETSRG